MDASRSELESAVAREVDARFEREQVPLLARLVEQPSCTREKDDVEAAFAILDAAAEGAGLSITVHPDPSGVHAAHRVYATRAIDGDARALALVGHLDTVFPRSMGFFGFRRDGDVARGPGVLDMKSGLTSILAALTAVRAVSPERYEALRLRFVCVSDEEVGSPSSSSLFAALAPGTSEALVFEAGRKQDRIVTRRKGGGLFRIEARGTAAHAGNAHARGVSAIWALARAIDRVERLTDYARGLTVSVGLVEGGTAKNTVPDLASCWIDARFETARDLAWLEAQLAAIAADPFGEDAAVPERVRGATLSLSGGATRPPMEATDASQALRARYEACAIDAGLLAGEAPLQGGGSDACLLAAAGVPSIDGLGPFGEKFHEREEWCSLSSLRRRTEALARFLVRHA